MAKNKGLIKIKGSIGGMTFYENDGKDLVRETGGVDKERILKDPAFKRTRENMAEFGGSAKIGKALRMGLSAVAKSFGDRLLVSRIVKLVRAVISRGPGARGKRIFEIIANKDILEGFELNEKDVLGSVFNAPHSIVTNGQRNETTLTVPDFDTDAFIQAPEGSTHFRLINAIGTLSNFSHNPGTGKYQATDAALSELGAMVASAEIPIGGMVGGDTILNPQLPGAPALTANVGLLGLVGIEFLQELNGDFYLLASGNAMRVAEVF